LVASRRFLNALGTAHERQLHRLWRDPAAWTRSADVFVVLTALAIPWSTSLVAILAVAWLLTLVPMLDIKYFMQTLKRPICALPIALFGLAAVGTFWSDTPWVKRLLCDQPDREAAGAADAILSF